MNDNTYTGYEPIVPIGTVIPIAEPRDLTGYTVVHLETATESRKRQLLNQHIKAKYDYTEAERLARLPEYQGKNRKPKYKEIAKAVGIPYESLWLHFSKGGWAR